ARPAPPSGSRPAGCAVPVMLIDSTSGDTVRGEDKDKDKDDDNAPQAATAIGAVTASNPAASDPTTLRRWCD
ncbi:hypothetical protein, partial [Xanthomonas fragariae]|uniref:hypothetical protein n=1 Tax=Xanthomonas fragariae TaxID=48664 RepID=UPI00131F44FD